MAVSEDLQLWSAGRAAGNWWQRREVRTLFRGNTLKILHSDSKYTEHPNDNLILSDQITAL